MAAEMADEYQRLLGRLGEPDLRAIALWKVEGWSNEDIAGRLGCATRTVERKLLRIRIVWSEETPP
jgi:DNA-directed RNA polymerase specialized sigma24 family protein